MSFSYKTLNSNDITLTSYIANKSWEVKNNTLSENGITIYIGENLPISRDYPFNPENDSKTSNNEYRRLIFESVKNLFYKNYTSGSLTGEFFQSSSYFNYEQSTLASGSTVSTFRNLSTITGSLYNPNNSTNYDGAIYDNSSSLYNETSFDPDKGGRVAIISIDQNIFGSGLSPNTVFISGSGYYLRDDGEGNFYDYESLSNYNYYKENEFTLDLPQLNLIGNIFYSHGLIIITNEYYICAFGSPPTATNDYFSYLNMNPLQYIDVISNDYSDCGTIIFDTFTTHSIEGYTFPDFTYENGFINITQNQNSLIPGDYKLGYNISNNLFLPSNTASINLTVTSQPLVIENIISESICFGTASILPVTFSINYGVPHYSYSLDDGATYTGVSNLFNVTVSGSMTASLNNTIYVKDYLGDITTASFASWYPPVTYNVGIVKNPCSSTSNDGILLIGNKDSTAISVNVNGTGWYNLPRTYTSLATGSYNIEVVDINNCSTSSVVTLTPYTPLTASVTMSHVNCYGSSTGQININLSNVIDNLLIDFIDPTGSYVFNNTPITSSTLTFSNLMTGSWTASIFTNDVYGCQNYFNTFTITGSSLINFSTTASYIDSCSNQIIFNAEGGLGDYNYFAQNSTTGQTFSSTSSVVPLFTLDGGIFNTYIVDGGSCLSSIQTQEIYGRTYIYSGSYCEQI